MKNIFLLFIILASLAEAKPLTIVHYDPFKKAKVLLKSKSVKIQPVSQRKKPLSINAILNKKVYINGKFYVVGKVVHGYKILAIADKYIKVKKNKRISIIPLIKSNYFDNIHIKGQL